MRPDFNEDYVEVVKLWVMSILMKSTNPQKLSQYQILMNSLSYFIFVNNFIKNDIVDISNLDTKLVDKKYLSFCCVIVTYL